MAFLNLGYEEEPPTGVPLAAPDELDRYCIQLYHRTATQADLSGKLVLEVSCGHGGGASDLVRTLRPAAYTGLDLNPAGIEICRKTHTLPGLDFVAGNAEDLPFDDRSFDAVINIEASHCYPSPPRFFSEVARVLRPDGHLLYADVRRFDHFAEWDKELADAPLRMVSQRDISAEVVRGLTKSLPRSQQMFTRRTPRLLRGMVNNAVAAPVSKMCDGLQKPGRSRSGCAAGERRRPRPPGPRGRPVIGVLRQLKADPFGYLQHLRDVYGDVYRLPLPMYDVVIVNHPDHVRHIMAHCDGEYSMTGPVSWARRVIGAAMGYLEAQFLPAQIHQRFRVQIPAGWVPQHDPALPWPVKGGVPAILTKVPATAHRR